MDHQSIKDQWQMSKLDPQGSAFSAKYLTTLAIDTNQIDGIFLISTEVRFFPREVLSRLIQRTLLQSAQDLVRHGITDCIVQCLPDSARDDPAEIKSILNDTLAVRIIYCIVSSELF